MVASSRGLSSRLLQRAAIAEGKLVDIQVELMAADSSTTVAEYKQHLQRIAEIVRRTYGA